MEPNIVGKLDRPDSRGEPSSADHPPELEGTLILKGDRLSSRVSEALTRVPEILAVSVVQRGNLSLHVTILLQRIGHIVVLRREQSNLRHPRGKATCEVSSTPGVPGVERNLGLHAHDFIASIKDLEGLELSQLAKVRVASDRGRALAGTHCAKHVGSGGSRGAQGLYGFHLDISIVAVTTSTVRLGNCRSATPRGRSGRGPACSAGTGFRHDK